MEDGGRHSDIHEPVQEALITVSHGHHSAVAGLPNKTGGSVPTSKGENRHHGGQITSDAHAVANPETA